MESKKDASLFVDHFQFVRVDDVFSLKASQLDYFDIKEKLESKSVKPETTALATQRTTMNLKGLKQLIAALDEFKDSLRQHGIEL